MLSAALVALLAAAVVMGFTAAVSRRLNRVAVVYVAWGLAFVAIALTLALVRPDAHSWLLAALVTAWGGRLAWHIERRSRGHGEDPRYEKMLGGPGLVRRRRPRRHQGLPRRRPSSRSSSPRRSRSRRRTTSAWWPVVWAGVVVWAVGVFFEVVGDAQSRPTRPGRASRARENPRSAVGWSRHPNYFGDACVWWGLWIAGALAVGWLPGLLTVWAPAAMTYFVRNVTGAKLLERTMSQREGWTTTPSGCRCSSRVPRARGRARTSGRPPGGFCGRDDRLRVTMRRW